MKHLLLLLLAFVFTSVSVRATHIMGGELTYVCLGNYDYEITLKLYRDCYNGAASYDNPTNVFVFNASGDLVVLLPITFPGSDTLDVVSSCGPLPPNLCIEEAIFVYTVNLPPVSGGYTMVYQRCCRSQIVDNLETPLQVGISISATIPDPSFADCNNSPVFNVPPPAAFCTFIPIFYDHSATDPDGDSLVYELCSATTGADEFNPYPNPAEPPPYADAVYVYPYSGTYPFSTNPALAIDAETGLITGTPESEGIYDLTACVKEYRNGVLIATHKRDMGQVITYDGVAMGITGVQNNASVLISPNPAADQLRINFTDVKNPFETLQIYNQIGMLGRAEQLDGDDMLLPVESFLNGVFQFQFSGNNQTLTRQVVIQR